MSSQPGPLMTASLAALVTGTVAYVVYFDYRRRSASEYRRELRRQERQLERFLKDEAEAELQQDRNEMRRMLLEARDPLPQEPQEMQDYMVDHFSMGQHLVDTGGDPKAAAFHFFRALQFAPNKQKFASAYDGQLPKKVFDYVQYFMNTSRDLATESLSVRGLHMDYIPAVGPD